MTWFEGNNELFPVLRSYDNDIGFINDAVTEKMCFMCTRTVQKMFDLEKRSTSGEISTYQSHICQFTY